MESFLPYDLEFCYVLVAVRLNHLYCKVLTRCERLPKSNDHK